MMQIIIMIQVTRKVEESGSDYMDVDYAAEPGLRMYLFRQKL